MEHNATPVSSPLLLNPKHDLSGTAMYAAPWTPETTPGLIGSPGQVVGNHAWGDVSQTEQRARPPNKSTQTFLKDGIQ